MKPRSRNPEHVLFVTVGSTKFDELIIKAGKSVDIVNEDSVRALEEENKVEIEIYDYKSSLVNDINGASLVIGHAGAGTCLEALRAKKRLLVVINETLMDNHQNELANQLSDDNYVIQTNISDFDKNLVEICREDLELNEFPHQNESKFGLILDEALGKANSHK